MTTYAYLEAALNADGAAELQTEHSELLDYSLTVIDSLVQQESEYVRDNLGQFIVQEDLEETYESIQVPSGDIVIEAITMFADVISSTGYTIDEKKDIIQCGALAIGLELDPMDILNEGIEEVAKTATGFIITQVDNLMNLFKSVDPTINPDTIALDSSGILRSLERFMPDTIHGIGDAANYSKEGILSTFDALIRQIQAGGAQLQQQHNLINGHWGKLLNELPLASPPWLINGANDILDTMKEAAGNDVSDTAVVSVAIAGIALTILAIIAIAISLWKIGAKKPALAVLNVFRKALSKAKVIFKKAKKKF